MNTPHPLPTQYGLLLALCMASLLALWWFMLGARHSARRRMLRRRIEALELPADAALQGAVAATQAAALQMRETLLRSSALRGLNQPLYDLPWLLFIGGEDAGLPALLAAARRDAAPAPAPAPDAGAEPAFWRWHLLPAMVAIEAGPAAMREPATPQSRGLWLHALLALADQRERLPLNGIVVCMSAAALLGDGQRLAADAQRLRQRIDEAAELLRLHLPIYLLVTGLERLPGYAVLRAALPAPVRAQALGHRLPDGIAAAGRSDMLFEPLIQRLHALRMGLLRGEPEPARRQAIHVFIEQLRTLQPGLRITAQHLFGPSGGHAHARWRGLYLVAAPALEDEAAFIQDLFRRFLPADQPLAR
ncbi:type VI secretion system protein [Variovorax sp. JS1663]|uniref:type VI secretion system protein n=1 Tax=Variovorax sp. JS1663 TaxID=1851577 RepID=UPI000B34609C|nr:type VI secretion system protein [Variovorax sp. JS1663]OUL99155.1 hypothetical protein A8M77_27985 [Variovorax sp. JS1663]